MFRFASGRFIVLSFVSMAFLSACSHTFNTTGTPADKKITDAQQRWPDVGSFDYTLPGQDNDGHSCFASHAFGRKSEYCLALEDRALNDGCASEQRKTEYDLNCGPDFEETNIPAKGFFGYDSRLERSCSIPTPANFENLTAYCAFLKDESQAKSCHWDDRRREFIQNHCDGAFSVAPAAPTPPPPAPTPMPTATPKPLPTPLPTPPPDSRPQVVKDLEAGGIEVSVENDMPGSETGHAVDFRTQVQRFYETLAANESALLSRKAYIKEIHLSIYSNYHFASSSQTLNVYLSSDEVRTYLNLLDREVGLNTALKMALDLGIADNEFGTADKFANYRALLDDLEAQSAALHDLANMIGKLEVTSYSNYRFTDKTLSLNRDKAVSDLSTYIAKLKPLAGFTNFLVEQQITFDCRYDLDQNGPELASVIAKLDKSRDSLSALQLTGHLSQIALYPGSDVSRYYESSKELWPASTGAQFDNVDQVIRALASSYKMTTQLGVPLSFNFGDSGLSEDLIPLTAKFKTHFEKIHAKIRSIQALTLSSLPSSFDYNHLTIGKDASDAALDQILRKIQ